MSVTSVLTNLRSSARFHGWSAALQLLFLQLLRKFVTFERVFLVAFDHVPTGLGLTDKTRVRLATADEVKTLARDRSFDLADFTPAEIDRLYAAGHRCMFNWVEGKIAGYSWMATDEGRIPKLHVGIVLRANEGYVYKGFTHPDFRGKRVGNDRYFFWLDHLKAQGRSTLLCDFAFDNKSTLRRLGKLELKKTGTATLVGVGVIRKLFLSGDFRNREIRPL